MAMAFVMAVSVFIMMPTMFVRMAVTTMIPIMTITALATIMATVISLTGVLTFDRAFTVIGRGLLCHTQHGKGCRCYE
jgi:hypothetical protein